MKIVAILLVVLGTLALLYGGFTVVYPDKIVDVGPIELSVDKKKSVPIPAIVGVLALVGGVGLFAMDRKK